MRNSVKTIKIGSVILAAMLAQSAGAQTSYGTGAGTGGGSTSSYFGTSAGASTTGAGNTFIGSSAGAVNVTGTNNSALGAGADVIGTVTNSTAIGAGAKVGLSNSVVLGNNTNVGIGLTDPYKRLDILTSTNNDAVHITQSSTGSGYAGLELFNQTTNGRNWGILSLGNGNSQGAGNLLIFDFTSSSSRIFVSGANGNVGISTVTPGAYKLNVNGDTYTSGAYFSSDLRFKKNIESISRPLSLIGQLQGVRYTFRDDLYLPTPEGGEEAPQKRNFPEGIQMGLIAQEVEKILPEVVKTGDDGYKAIAYQNIVPLLIEGIKDQQKQIEEKDAAIKDLQQKLEMLTQRVDQLSTGGGKAITEISAAYLEQNAPNPFSTNTVIRFFIPENNQGTASIMVYSSMGQLVKTFPVSARGKGEITISANELASGNYIYELQVNGQKIDSKKLVLISAAK